MAIHPMALAQLRAMRATCEATIWQIDALLAFNDSLEESGPTLPQSPPSPPLPNSEQEETSQEDSSDPIPEGPMPCSHPPEWKQAAPAMGRPTRGICRLCNKEVQ